MSRAEVPPSPCRSRRLPRLQRLGVTWPVQARDRSCRGLLFHMSLQSALPASHLALLHRSSALRSSPLSRGLITTMASADSLKASRPKGLLGSVTGLSTHAVQLYSKPFDDVWASRLLAHSPLTYCLSAGSCSYSQVFASALSTVISQCPSGFHFGWPHPPPARTLTLHRPMTCQAHERRALLCADQCSAFLRFGNYFWQSP